MPATRRSARRRPQAKRLIADPNCQITALPQSLVVFSPVGHPMLLLRDLCSAISVELVRHSQHPDENKPRQYQPTADLCNTTNWNHEKNWNVQEAAFNGSSHYDLPVILRWITANIGVHHVHHLACRIPFYRLADVVRDHEILSQHQRLTIWESFHCARLHLWDEKSRKLLSFSAAREVQI
ncbi:MAG: fatty acid desaturase [Sulfitobacter sp.]